MPLFVERVARWCVLVCGDAMDGNKGLLGWFSGALKPQWGAVRVIELGELACSPPRRGHSSSAGAVHHM